MHFSIEFSEDKSFKDHPISLLEQAYNRGIELLGILLLKELYFVDENEITAQIIDPLC